MDSTNQVCFSRVLARDAFRVGTPLIVAGIAERTAKFLEVALHKKDMNEEAIASRFEDATWHIEHHNADLNYVGKFALSELPHKLGFKVVLTGEGSDEVFTGYPLYLSDVLREKDSAWNSSLTDEMRSRLFKAAETEAAKRHDLLCPEYNDHTVSQGRSKLKGIATITAMTNFMPSSVYADWVSKLQPRHPEDVIANDITPDVLKKMQQAWHPINTAQYVWTKGHLPNQFMSCLGDRTEMAHSIEGRLPFLDDRLTEYVYGIPPTVRMKWDGRDGFTEKYVLREAMKPFVTQEVYERSKHVSLPLSVYDRYGNSDLTLIIHAALHGSNLLPCRRSPAQTLHQAPHQRERGQPRLRRLGKSQHLDRKGVR